MGKLVHGIHHVALKCEGLAEFERVVAFYRDILDMEPVRTWGEGENVGIMLAAGFSCIEIFANAVDHPGQGAIRHVALAVSDVDACVAAVRAAGYPATVILAVTNSDEFAAVETEAKDAVRVGDRLLRIRK